VYSGGKKSKRSGGSEDRKMEICLPALQGEGIDNTWQPMSARESMPANFSRIRYQNAQNHLLADKLFVLNLKESKYDPLSSCLVDFKERANCSSVKNFQACKSCPEDAAKRKQYYSQGGGGESMDVTGDAAPVLLQLGKVGKNCFNCDFQSPLSLLQAFGIALSRFDTRHVSY
jgi:hypothetical protein